MAERACHVFGSATQVGLIQVLGRKISIMQSFIKQLGKPRSWLVFAAACVVGVVAGASCVALYFAGVHMAGRIGFWLAVACWAVAALSCLSYFAGLASGRYRDLQGKGWAELPW